MSCYMIIKLLLILFGMISIIVINTGKQIERGDLWRGQVKWGGNFAGVKMIIIGVLWLINGN